MPVRSYALRHTSLWANHYRLSGDGCECFGHFGKAGHRGRPRRHCKPDISSHCQKPGWSYLISTAGRKARHIHGARVRVCCNRLEAPGPVPLANTSRACSASRAGRLRYNLLAGRRVLRQNADLLGADLCPALRRTVQNLRHGFVSLASTAGGRDRCSTSTPRRPAPTRTWAAAENVAALRAVPGHAPQAGRASSCSRI